MLKGKYLSVVQTRALEILAFLDAIEETRDRVFQIKLAMVSAGAEASALFPEHFLEKKDAPAESPKDEFEGEKVEWLSPSMMDNGYEEYQKLLNEVLANKAGTVNGNHMTVTPWR